MDDIPLVSADMGATAAMNMCGGRDVLTGGRATGEGALLVIAYLSGWELQFVGRPLTPTDAG